MVLTCPLLAPVAVHAALTVLPGGLFTTPADTASSFCIFEPFTDLLSTCRPSVGERASGSLFILEFAASGLWICTRRCRRLSVAWFSALASLAGRSYFANCGSHLNSPRRDITIASIRHLNMTSQVVKDTPASGVPKHRACDECRARKLACSKEPDGCARCKREGIPCHYSPQKPMGRPRKRRHVDSLPEAVSHPQNAAPNGLTGSETLGGFDSQPGLSMDANLDFFSQDAGSNMTFVDLLPNSFYEDGGDGLYGLHPYSYSQPHVSGQNEQIFGGSAVSMQLTGAVLLQGINFGEPDPSATTASKDINDSLQRFMASQHPSPPEEPPQSACSDMSSAVDTPEMSPSASGTVKAMPSISCGCLSSLYLALESLSHLPPDVTSAMRVARGACKVAQDVIDCRHCSNAFFDDPLKPPPIQAFQNLFLLGALVPSACNAYASILEMVDNEADSAKRESRTFFFSFKEVGGLWGNVADDHGCCSAIHGLNNSHLDPDVWRTTIRAILRLDVYGLGDSQGSIPPASRRQKGLKDVLQQLDEMSRKRHEIMDELIANDRVPRHSPYIMSPMNYPPCPPEQRNCVKILETARMALDSLVIA
ncbi:Uncharacterized protein TPAR_00355 [Tolypocladium paradoxum]|uniref:Zn(2)-C6 fungal-type domain-containing protein n=1 Tax=Tolypocladium paradoxum TaxID=94208 RepID=A0A2S4LAH2_9HYPO|nr:Uncharacterized protein TPAR_00355 [Tolypocladium paradoxum]